MSLIPLHEARRALLAEIDTLGSESVSSSGIAGRVLAEDVTAPRALPPRDVSAMDGYAVADEAGPWTVVDDIPAGAVPARPLQPGEAARVFTGAPVPKGTARVVMQERVAREGGQASLTEAHSEGDHIRRRGVDMAVGDVLLRAGTRLGGVHAGLIAAADRAYVAVRRRPRVLVLSSGDELAEPGRARPDDILASAAPGVAGLLDAWGAAASVGPILRDSRASVAEGLLAASEKAYEAIVVIGGASVGDHDLIRPVAAELGLTPLYAGVAVRPGKPAWAGRWPNGPLLIGLPGNPASAFVTARLLAVPAVLAWLGAKQDGTALAQAATEDALGINGPRELWARAKRRIVDGRLLVSPARNQDSSLLTPFATADALLRRGPHAPAANAGDLVDVLPLLPEALS